ncbi:MAG: sodium:proton antiporter [Oscillatoriophycideae cyanobacterium NC_groundwater_1537_Pr4_S-0.65um_50_18]|nr:sodium:proton antiporter [Oscillatoriophycideae cyanobacterium NC_groundwater_1537_Pr4_S-0.65um_50_18]
MIAFSIAVGNLSLSTAPPAASLTEKGVATFVPDLIILLLVATTVALLSRRLRIPYVTGLVLAGLALTEFLPNYRIGLESSLILNLFLPILLFEAAINTDISRLRSTMKPIAMLAIPGVIVSTGVTAVGLKFALSLDWVSALLLGTILAITDTVSVIAVFKEVAVPSRLTTIVEGESLLNDGVALVLFNLVLQVHYRGSVSFTEGVQQFFIVIVGGSLVGLAIGYLSAGLMERSDDNLSSILLTVAVALGTYQVGHFIGVSGVVADVVAGLWVGNVGLSHRASASNRVTLYSFWDYAGFGVNTFIFLLIGVEVDLPTLWQTFPAVLVAILAYQAGRILSVYPLLALLNRFDRPISMRWQHVLFLGNIKGSLSMALALSLPASLLGRGYLIAIVFGSVLLSLVLQGLSLPWLVERLNLSSVSPERQQTDELRAQLITSKAAQDELDGMLKAGILPKAIYEEMRSLYQVRIAKAEKALRDLYNQWSMDVATGKDNPSRLDGVRRRLLLAEKVALTDAVRKRILPESTAEVRLQHIDEKLLSLEDD